MPRAAALNNVILSQIGESRVTKAKIGPAIREEDYESFRKLSPDLPDTFGEWASNAADIDRRLKDRGVTLDRIVIDPDGFAAWTRARGMK